MALDGALLITRETVNAGAQVAGIVAQYQKSGVVGTTAVIHPADTSMQVTLGGPKLTIIGTVPPGKPGITQISGQAQHATKLVCNNQPLGNTLPSTASQGVPPVSTGNPPTVNAAQVTSAGLSLSPEHE